MPGNVLVGPGDDAALVRVGDADILLTVDQFVAGRHYDPASSTNAWIAQAALGRSLSDIAAMGGVPTHALCAATIGPDCPDPDALFDAMAAHAQSLSVSLVGGDIAMSDGPTVLTVTVVGVPHTARGAVLRSGACVGDSLYVTGALGGAASSSWTMETTPRLAEAKWLCDTLDKRLTSMIDISDGLGRDAGRVARASGAQLIVEAHRVPVAPGATLEQAVSGGQDYELLFTASGDVPERCDATGITITRIGSVHPGRGCLLRSSNGDARDISEAGWDHTRP